MLKINKKTFWQVLWMILGNILGHILGEDKIINLKE